MLREGAWVRHAHSELRGTRKKGETLLRRLPSPLGNTSMGERFEGSAKQKGETKVCTSCKLCRCDNVNTSLRFGFYVRRTKREKSMVKPPDRRLIAVGIDVEMDQRRIVRLALNRPGKARLRVEDAANQILPVPGGSVRGERANLKGLVLGCIEAKFCK